MSVVFTLLMLAATPRFTVLTCDGEVVEDVELVHALELEVQRTGGAVTRCGEQWRFASERFEPVVVDLSHAPMHLRARTFALAVQAALTPVVSRPEKAPPRISPPPPPPPQVTAPAVQLQLDIGARLFVLAPASATGDLLVRAMTKWRFWVGVELALTNVKTSQASVRSLVALGLLGARVFEVPLGAWAFVGDLAAELGALTTNTTSWRDGYRGTNSLVVMVGGWALVGFQRVFGDEVALQVAARAGYDRGVRVQLLGVPVLNLDGPFVGLQVGIRF